MPETDRPLILVADDTEDNRELYATYFRHFGFPVETASEGEETVAKALNLGPAVIILDLTMPRRGGLDIAKRLKSDERTRNTRIIAVTGAFFGQSREARGRQAATRTW